jgi:uncharacterized PurR-regulated membrane protein YhhQ (DUF165 family)
MPLNILQERRERVFIVFAGVFLASMAMLNIIGITHFVHIGPLALAVGVLPYPLTFLCTDIISELFGRRRANFVVLVGLGINMLVICTVWLAQALPPIDEAVRPNWLPEGSWEPPPWQRLPLATQVPLPNGEVVADGAPLFRFVYACTAGAVLASMCAYAAAQFCDVYLFHLWKRLTKGKHLWLRNNASTMVSQLVDATMVITITFGPSFLRNERTATSLLILIGSNYLFKFCVALADTIPCYICVNLLSKYLHVDPMREGDT